MGKMLVYKSGAVKLKLGDVLFDVSHFRLVTIRCEPTYLILCWNHLCKQPLLHLF